MPHLFNLLHQAVGSFNIHIRVLQALPEIEIISSYKSISMLIPRGSSDYKDRVGPSLIPI